MNTSKQAKIAKLAAIIIGILALTTAAIFFYLSTSNQKPTSSPTNNAQVAPGVDQANSDKGYTSAEYGFSSTYLNKPKIERKSITVQKNKVPYIIFASSATDGKTAYTVSVTDYPPAKFDFKDKERDALQAMVDSMTSTTCVIQKPADNTITYENFPAASALHNCSAESATYELRSFHILRETRVYSIMMVGGTEDQFNLFKNDFRLLNPDTNKV